MQFWKWFSKVLLLSVVSATRVRHPDSSCLVRQEFANCSNIGLTHLPHDLPPSITEIDASHNRLLEIQWPLPYFHLINLNLSKNNIHQIAYHAFLHLFSLDTLDLSFNNIRYLSHLDSNYTFFNTPQLVHLILRGNPLKSLGTDAIRSDSLRRLDVSECDIRNVEGETALLLMPNLLCLLIDRNPLTKIDILFSESLEELYLVETQLRYLKPEFYMGLPKLIILDISKNFYLTNLSKIGMANSSTLKILKAEFCSIEYLQIQGFPRLERVYLKGNRIVSITRGDFSANSRLLEVDLSKNWIHQVGPMGFAGADSLTKLDLSGNKIFELGNSLSYLPRLTCLNISNNPLTTIDGIELAPFIEILDVSHCEVSFLPINFFSLEQLESVNLSRNAIWSLPPGMSSFTLIELNLGYNRLSEVKDSWFKHFPRLKSLHLEGNRLTEPFYRDTLKRLEHVQLHLQDNPWRCNCGEERYRNFYKHLSAKGRLDSLRCHGPTNVTGLTWKFACFVTEAEASVKKPSKKNAWLPMLLAALTTLGIIFLLYLLRRRSGSREENRPTEAATIPSTRPRSPFMPRSPPRHEANLPSYEEALLMPKPKVTTKTNADTQTQVSFLGSVRSLDSRAKHALVRSPSSNSM